METAFSTMSQEELLKEFLLLSEVRHNLAQLAIYNPGLKVCIQQIDQDVKYLIKYLFYHLKNRNRVVDLTSLGFSNVDIQTRTSKYLQVI